MARRKLRIARKPAHRASPSKPRATKRPRAQALLIVQCDADKLERDGVGFSSRLKDIATACAPRAIVRRIRVTSQESFQLGLLEALQEVGSFDIVAVETHSNQQGLILGPNFRLTWEKFAEWLKPLSPRKALLVGCQAGRWLPSEALFNRIETLKEIYGSPVIATEPQFACFNVLVPLLLNNARLSKNEHRVMQAIQFLANGGIIFRQLRKEFERDDPNKKLLWVAAEELLKRRR